MKHASELEAQLHRLNGRGYKAYKEIAGAWDFDDFTLHVDHVQGDPFAAPSRVRVRLPPRFADLPSGAYRTPSRAVGTACYLARSFSARSAPGGASTGSGRSGEIRMEGPGQEVLPQTAVLVGPEGDVEARFTVGLPARGRRVLGREAARLLGQTVPGLVRDTLLASSHDPAELLRHAEANEDADALRVALGDLELVAFVADGAALPRRSGVDDRPLRGEQVVPFSSPPSLRTNVRLPNAGTITGMGLPRGVTLVVGGGFHGKSTLLAALEKGVFNHRPDDGRERVVCVADAVKIRAEDGRSVQGVDISPFIDGLPLGGDTTSFSSPNASGSTSQAAAIVEAMEAGSRTLLVDEDTSATNFMIRDRRMQALVPKDSEPITPFVDRIRALVEERAVSAVLVLGGSGDYLDVADTVIAMRDYVPHDVTGEAVAVAAAHPTGRVTEVGGPISPMEGRIPAPGSLDPRKGRRDVNVKVPDGRTLLFGTETVDVAAVEQLISRSQIRAIGQALAFIAKNLLDSRSTVSEILDAVDDVVAEGGLDALEPRRVGDLAAFRRFELGAALSRIRSLRLHR